MKEELKSKLCKREKKKGEGGGEITAKHLRLFSKKESFPTSFSKLGNYPFYCDRDVGNKLRNVRSLLTLAKMLKKLKKKKLKKYLNRTKLTLLDFTLLITLLCLLD